jgi:hypothetical protein
MRSDRRQYRQSWRKALSKTGWAANKSKRDTVAFRKKLYERYRVTEVPISAR